MIVKGNNFKKLRKAEFYEDEEKIRTLARKRLHNMAITEPQEVQNFVEHCERKSISPFI